LNPEMSCGIGMFGLNGADPRKLADALQAKHNIYTAVSPHAEYTGIRVTPSVYTTLAEVDYFVSAVEKELKNI
jgi:isopenicillin-N epimerase